MISIVIVSFNTKNDFELSLRSIIKQTYKNYEIIVVDGKSSDGTINTILKYKKLFKKIIIEKDKGIYHAMNKGINFISSGWTIFLNSGDVFLNKNTLKKISYYLNKEKNIDVLVGNTIIKKNNYYYKHVLKKLDKKSFLSSFSHQATVLKSNLLKKRNFNLKYKIAADFDFFTFLFNKKKNFYYINNYLSINKSGGLSDKKRIRAIKEFLLINIKYRKKNNYYLIYILALIKIILFQVIKKIIPNKIVDYLVKLKYRKMIYKI